MLPYIFDVFLKLKLFFVYHTHPEMAFKQIDIYLYIYIYIYIYTYIYDINTYI